MLFGISLSISCNASELQEHDWSLYNEADMTLIQEQINHCHVF